MSFLYNKEYCMLSQNDISFNPTIRHPFHFHGRIKGWVGGGSGCTPASGTLFIRQFNPSLKFKLKSALSTPAPLPQKIPGSAPEILVYIIYCIYVHAMFCAQAVQERLRILHAMCLVIVYLALVELVTALGLNFQVGLIVMMQLC